LDQLHDAETHDDARERLGSRPARTAEVPGYKPFRRYIMLLGCAATVLVADQVLKWLVMRSLQHGRVIDLLGGLVRLDFTRNAGAAFGMFQSGGLLFAAVAVLVSLSILVFYRRIAESALAVRLALGLILGGALGNLLDRIRLGYVVDYVDLRWWYVFNLADSAIVVGVAILLLVTSLDSTAHSE
jgi:signal peptidase II